MRQVYLREIRKTEGSIDKYYTYDRLLDPGFVLVLTNLTISWPDMSTSESGEFFIDTGGQRVFLGDGVPARTGGWGCWHGQAVMGEHSRVGVYTPDSEANDVITFCVAGELWTREAWRKMSVSIPEV